MAKTVENKETVLQFLALNAQADVSAIAERLDLSKQRARAILKEMMAD
ncbi:MAG: MarR family transcriptional regulator [Firmicutes bacterium]|nr:MarR family transcriptional regulator [Bacillota bacterium]